MTAPIPGAERRLAIVRVDERLREAWEEVSYAVQARAVDSPRGVPGATLPLPTGSRRGVREGGPRGQRGGP